MAGRQGFEPRYRGPEPRVLPLDDLPIEGLALSEALKAAPSRRAETLSISRQPREHTRPADERDDLEQPWTDGRAGNSDTDGMNQRPGLDDARVGDFPQRRLGRYDVELRQRGPIVRERAQMSSHPVRAQMFLHCGLVV